MFFLFPPSLHSSNNLKDQDQEGSDRKVLFVILSVKMRGDRMAEKRGNAGKTGLKLAQEEWERRMRAAFRQDDTKEDPEGSDDIGYLIKKRNEKRQTRRIRLTKEIKKQGPLKQILYQYPARTDAGEGMRFARDNVEPFVGKTADLSRWGIALSMLADLRGDSSFNENYEKAMDIRDS